MKLNVFSKIFVGILLTLLAVSSCAEDSEYDIFYSKNAVVNSFTIAGTPTSALDTLLYPYFKTARFAVDLNGVSSNRIYNPDSLPANIRVGKLAVTLGFGGSPSGVELVYPDSTAVWNTTDSIDFSAWTETYPYPEMKVVAADGVTFRTYKIELRIHKIDPDSILWIEQTKIPVVGISKTILHADGKFYSLVDDAGSISCFSTSKAGALAWSKNSTNLPLTTVIESFYSNENLFAVVTTDRQSFTSTNGTNWTKTADAVSIIGVLPKLAGSTESEFMVVMEEAGVKYFAKTTDFSTLAPIANVTGRPNAILPTGFPMTKYSSVIYDAKESLFVTGGFTELGETIRKTWRIINKATDEIQVTESNKTNVYPTTNGGASTFLYNDKLYALAGDLLYYTADMASTWKKPFHSQVIEADMKGHHRPSVVTDEDNYIWFFGGFTPDSLGAKPVDQVWKGRMNRLAQ